MNWSWTEIFIVAMARLAPKGMELNPDDVVALPLERVLIDHRGPRAITFTWVSIEEANGIALRERLKGDPASKSELQGRYQKLTVLLLWKLAKDGITLTEADSALIPDGKFLFEDGIEYKWLPVAEGMALRKRIQEHEGRDAVKKA